MKRNLKNQKHCRGSSTLEVGLTPNIWQTIKNYLNGFKPHLYAVLAVLILETVVPSVIEKLGNAISAIPISYSLFCPFLVLGLQYSIIEKILSGHPDLYKWHLYPTMFNRFHLIMGTTLALCLINVCLVIFQIKSPLYFTLVYALIVIPTLHTAKTYHILKRIIAQYEQNKQVRGK